MRACVWASACVWRVCARACMHICGCVCILTYTCAWRCLSVLMCAFAMWWWVFDVQVWMCERVSVNWRTSWVVEGVHLRISGLGEEGGVGGRKIWKYYVVSYSCMYFFFHIDSTISQKFNVFLFSASKSTKNRWITSYNNIRQRRIKAGFKAARTCTGWQLFEVNRKSRQLVTSVRWRALSLTNAVNCARSMPARRLRQMDWA